MNSKHEIQFIHANGFPPNAYTSLLKGLNNHFNIEKFLLRPLNNKYNANDIKNWIPFHNDYIELLSHKNHKVIGLGHSIGGNVTLRACISHPEYFSKIILLDPTLFVPKIIFFWKLALFLKLHNYLHPWVKATLRRKMYYKNYDSIFKSYRNKTVFKHIDDENLNIYIKSITTSENDGEIKIIYSKEWEYQIYKTGLIADNYIWKNIKYLNIPTLIIRSKSSNAFLASSAKKINKLNKKIKIVTLDNTTHLFPLETPETVAKIINDYLQGFN